MRLLILLFCAVPVAGSDLKWEGPLPGGPVVMPSPWVPYGDVRDMVDAGKTVRIAVGVDAPPGYVLVRDGADYGIAKGLWRCYRTPDGRAVMVPESPPEPEPVRRPLLPHPILPNVQALLGRQPPCVGGT